jgi:hypothetical protein
MDWLKQPDNKGLNFAQLEWKTKHLARSSRLIRKDAREFVLALAGVPATLIA